jgi:uncharacterized protein YciW
MAFETAPAKVTAITKAGAILNLVRAAHDIGTRLQAAVVLYQSNTDPAFNAAFNALFSPTERQELATMIAGLTSVMTDWETNHPAALG